LGDDFLEQFIQQRMKDMMGREASGRVFGTVEHLKDGDQYLKAVDNQDKETCVLVLLFEPNAPGCTAALRALNDIARDHPRIKFCSVRPSAISMSANFRIGGVPALLSYQAGQVTGNFVKFTTELGFDFESSDLESFLVENGILNDRSLVPQVARNLKTYESSDSD
jgi:Phosducin